MSKIKRIIAGLLAALNILTIMPLVDTGQLMDAAYADNGTHVGNTDGEVVVTGSGTWSSYAENVGYRMWLMDEDGNFVAEAGIADLRNEALPNKSFNMTTNVKIQKWTGEDAGNTIHKQMLFDNLIGVKNRLPKPMEAPSKGNYVGNGDAFTYWLTEGKADINAGGSGGGGIHHTYKPGGNKGPTGGSTGGSSGGSSGPSTGGPTGGSTGGSTGNTQPTVGSATQQLGKTYSNALAYVNAHRANITRSYAIQYIQACIKAKRDELCKGLTGTERHPIIDAAAEYIDMVYRELSENGWKSTDASRLINTENQTEFLQLPESSAIKKDKDGTITIDLFDLAYADGEHAIIEAGNIFPLLNDNNLFNLDGLPQQVYTIGDNGSQVRSGLETIAANKLKLIIEPLVWFQPATAVWKGKYKEDGKKQYEIGTSPSLWFYGTPTTYASMMNYQKGKKGFWHDGGDGGWYANPLNKVASQCLYLDLPLATTQNEEYIARVTPGGKKILNSDLGKTHKGYAMHYVMFNYIGADLPRTQTYDPFEKDPNPEPHKAPNPDPNYVAPNGKTPVPFVKDEPTEDWTDKWDGYKQLTRTVNIVKCYDIEHIDGTLEHVKTEARRWNPGTIAVMQEPDYKTVGWYTSPYYIGYDIFQGYTMTGSAQPEHGLRVDWMEVFYDAQMSGDWDDSDKEYLNSLFSGGGMRIIDIDTTWQGMKDRLIEISPTYGISQKFYNEIPYDEDAEAGKVVGTVVIGAAADTEFDPDSGEMPKEGYDDTTLYVHLIKKEKIPETSTWDEPKYPPAGNPPVVPPNAPPNPFDPPITDPETDPPSETYSHYRIVKVYETEDETTGQIDTDAILHRFPTNPIVHIEDEAQKGKPDFSYHLIEWLYGDEYNGVKWNDKDERPNGEDWDGVISGVNPKGAGTTEAKVDLIDKENVEETVTLYVRLRRKTGSRVPGEIIIEQSQISKVIHSNDKNIGGRFGDYRFAMTVGDFKISHIAYYNHCCVGGDHRYHSCRCLGHTCYHEMPGRAGDNKLNFNFDLISSQHDLEIPKGVFSKTDPKVYGKGGSSFDAITSGVDYPKTISSLYASDNKWYFTSDGNDSNGAEYVPILWRCSSGGLNDIPTLAKFKKNDITKRYSAENYTIPDKMLSSVGSTANKISNKKRASAPMAFPYEFTFGLHSRSDITATSSCVTHNGYNCIDTDTQDYYPIEGTEFTYDFKAGVAIQFYAGTAKGLQAAPFGGKATQPQLEKVIGKHTENNIIQCKQEIKFYPYIRMTYMVNSLEDAIKEEENTYETGYNQDVRKDTYVLSEWESSVLPSDAVTVSWKNKNEDESLLITSQQWSVHQKAVNGSEVWNGKNQVLPGGAIYQLSTPESNWTTVNITTYQTVVDQKARQEYLSNNLSGDEYTESKVAQDHLDFINDAKEVLDNLKLVQWVNKNPGASKAWTQDFVAKPSQGIVKILDGTSITTVDLSGLRGGSKTNPNDDQKYYMRQQTQISNYQQVTKLSEWTKTIDDAQSIKEQPYEGDMDVFNMKHETTVYKLFMDTSGDVYLASITKKYGNNDTGMDNTQSDIENMVKSMKDLNADTYAMGQTGGAKVEKLCNKKVSGSMINSILKDDAKEIDDATSFITNFVSALTRNKGSDYTAEWASDLTDGKWYNEAFDGVYLVKQSTTFNIGLAFSSSRVSALDPALCPQNKGQSDLYTSAFLSQFCLDSQSDATIAQGKIKNFIGTFKGVDITMPDMESMYVSKKFYLPNANVQDLN